ncbi:8142_t:CDS:2 [Funneliformis caledonium]|uniref:8142_t:CDS:1 n=1 Tax=Funneliformis caledonium TaxID=1117310 RepID=A0A9N9CAS4_9GLOM|nr:8142_t:CDS:2 [Funneliformis caledonium]
MSHQFRKKKVILETTTTFTTIITTTSTCSPLRPLPQPLDLLDSPYSFYYNL